MWRITDVKGAGGSKTTILGEHTVSVEMPLHHADGAYTIAVEWSEEDGAWLAHVGPLFCNAEGWVADGQTQVEALMNLAASLANLVNTFEEKA